MGEIAAVWSWSWRNSLMLQVHGSRLWSHCSGRKLLQFPVEWQCMPDLQRRWPSMMVVNNKKKKKMVSPDGSGSIYSSRIYTDIPLYESPGASFDRYLEDKPRVFRAIFPDTQRSQRLNEIRWELQGLDDIVKPSHFSLGVKGAMYPDRQGKPSLKGQLQMSMSFDVPPVLALVPEKIRRRVTESLLKRLVESMKHKVNGSLLADYSEFKREKLTV